MSIEFSESEIKEIQKSLGYLIDRWAHALISHVLKIARDEGVDVVYMNTSLTVDGNMGNEEKADYFYERLPPVMGFKKEDVELRDRGVETLWAYHLDTIGKVSSSLIDSLTKFAGKQYSLSDIPRTYQGAVLAIIGRKDFYDVSELQKVFEIIQKKHPAKEPVGKKFFYDWGKIWNGAQRFRNDIEETIVIQMSEPLTQTPALTKFWSFFLSQDKHGFVAQNSVGWILLCKINRRIWLINQIQTDVINKYRKLALLKDQEKQSIDINTLKDMLHAANRSNWIPRVEANERFRQSLLDQPNQIYQLCENDVDIDKWIAEQNAGGAGVLQGMDLIRHYQNFDFSRKIFRIGNG